MLFFLFVKKRADHHDHTEDDQIEKNRERKFSICRRSLIGTDTMRVDRNEDHKQGSDQSKKGHDCIFENVLFAFFFDEEDKDRDIHTVDRDDRKLRRIETENSEDRCREIGCIEIEEPCGTEEK